MENTALTMKDNGQALALTEPTFNLPALTYPEEIAEAIEANLEGLTPRFDRVKIPSGGGLAFELPGEDGPEVAKEIIGVILDHYPVNAYWKEKFSGANNPPDCSALDGKTGIGNPGGKCKTCPLNQFGSGIDPTTGEKTKGKACKNLHRIYIIRENEVFPLLLALPPTSLGNFSQYMMRLLNKRLKSYGVVTKIRLEKDKNAKGIEYSKAVFSKVAELTPEETRAIKAYAEQLRGAMRDVEIEARDYDIEAQADLADTGEVEPF